MLKYPPTSSVRFFMKTFRKSVFPSLWQNPLQDIAYISYNIRVASDDIYCVDIMHPSRIILSYPHLKDEIPRRTMSATHSLILMSFLLRITWKIKVKHVNYGRKMLWHGSSRSTEKLWWNLRRALDGFQVIILALIIIMRHSKWGNC